MRYPSIMLILAVVLAGLIVVSLFIGQNADGDDELPMWALHRPEPPPAAVKAGMPNSQRER